MPTQEEIQGEYVSRRNAINAAHAAFFGELTTAYKALKDGGADSLKLSMCRQAYRVLAHLAGHVCALYNECAGSVPMVQPVSGGTGPKDDDDDPEDPE